jgi:phosphate/sulfate permease
MPTEILVLFGIVLAAGFYMAWAIGANDVANAMGTSVGSGALTLRRAVIIAAILEFAGAYFFGSHVSETVQKGIVDPNIFTHNPQNLVYGMLAALLSAGTWLQVASYYGLPVSTTHSIVGALVGFGAVVGGVEAVKWENVGYIVTSWIISPLAGGVLGFYLFTLLRNQIFYTYDPIAAAKKLTPILVFFVAGTLSLMFVFDGLKNLHLEITFLQGMGISILLGAISSFISYFAVRQIPVISPNLKNRPQYGPEISYSLSRAKKHLGKIQAASIGELNYHVSHLLEEIENINEIHLQNIEKEVAPSEYTYVERIFGYLQILSASLMAFAHGANDVANAIGPLAAAVAVLMTGTISPDASIPNWALALGGAGIIVGLATWGWRVIETIGKKITELTPTRGFAAEFGAAITILIASRLGMPVSTTHTLVGAVIGVGLARGLEALNLGMTRDIIISWIVTVPAGAALAVGFFYVIQAAFG